MIHSVYFLTDVASVTNQPLLLLQFLIYLDGWLITISLPFLSFINITSEIYRLKEYN